MTLQEFLEYDAIQASKKPIVKSTKRESMTEYTVQIKPLSVNQAWQGRRYKTSEYKGFESSLMWLLPKDVNIPEGKLFLSLEFGVSPLFDWDNGIKPFQDILQKKYGFNDNRVYKASVEKVVVKKGNEYIKFMFTEYLKESK